MLGKHPSYLLASLVNMATARVKPLQFSLGRCHPALHAVAAGTFQFWNTPPRSARRTPKTVNITQWGTKLQSH